MAIRSVSDVFYTALARLPFLLLLAGVVWVICTGLLGLETYSFGTEYFIDNDQSTNVLPGVGQSSSQDVLDAISSGDVNEMSAALDKAAADQEAMYGDRVVAGTPGAYGA